MTLMVADCPRCNHARITFDVRAQNHVATDYGWKRYFELFCVCRNCTGGTIFLVSQDESAKPEPMKYDSANTAYTVERYIALSDMISNDIPENLDPLLEKIFREGATCKSVKCFNAAGTMFRLCVDLATRKLLPPPDQESEGLTAKARRDLGLRLPWLFNKGLLSPDLKPLSDCIREDGNDAAHQGTLTESDAEDLQDFAFELLNRIYSEPKRLELAKQRREARRNGKQDPENES